MKQWKRMISCLLILCMVSSLIPGWAALAAGEETTPVASGTCGEKLTWTLDGDGLLTISGEGKMDDYSWDNRAPWYNHAKDITRVVIGSGVTSVGDLAFQNCTRLTTLHLPEGLQTIGYVSFGLCVKLNGVAIPDSVMEIEQSAFSDCFDLEAFDVDSNNPKYCAVDGILYSKDMKTLIQCPIPTKGKVVIPTGVEVIGHNAFNCCSISELIIPNTVRILGDCAIGNCQQLTSITIPEGVEKAGRAVFLGCINLTSANIPASLSSMEDNMFDSCSSLREIEVAKNNSAYKLDDGIVYTMDGKTLVCYPGGRVGEVTIAEHATCIGKGSFGGVISLVNMVIPEGITKIEDGAFGFCENLETISIPESVKSIGYDVFGCCSKLKTIYYAGSERQWNAIEKGDLVPDGNIPTVHFTKENAPAEVIDSGKCGQQVNWKLDEDGLLTISGIGPMENYGWNWDTMDSPVLTEAPWKEYTSDIKKVVIEEGVTSIGDYAFEDCSNMTEVALPNGLKSIGKQAFRMSTGLTTLSELPASLEKIGDSAFIFSHLPAIRVDKDNLYFCAQDGILYSKDMKTLLLCPGGMEGTITIPNTVEVIGESAFQKCYRIDSVIIPSSVQKIEPDAFNMCVGINKVDIPEGVKEIGKSAFFSCSELTTVSIPTSVTFMDGNVFGSCDKLKTINIAAGNTAYKVEKGVLYTNDGKTLVCYPTALPGEIAIPNGVTCIGDSAFSWNQNLITLDIPSNVTEIGESAFISCHNLKTVNIPESVTKMGNYAFGYCNNLTDMYYAGSSAQWKAIDKDIFVFEESNPTIHFAKLTAVPGENGSVTIEGVFVGNVEDGSNDVVMTIPEATQGETTQAKPTMNVVLREESVDSLAKPEEATFTLQTEKASVSFDSTALDTMAAAEGDKTFTLEVSENTQGATVVTVNMTANNGNVFPESKNNGTITITVPYQAADGTSVDVIYNGERVDTVTVQKNTVTFTTTHFSEYILQKHVGYDVSVSKAKNGTVSVSAQSAAKGDKVTVIVKADKGYELDKLTVKTADGKNVPVTEKNGKYTFTMPDGKVIVTAIFKKAQNATDPVPDPEPAPNKFTDVPAGAYYADAVAWAVEKGITTGATATTFNPDGSCTRAQAVTFLWRAAGSPVVNGTSFADVVKDSYYEQAVIWAVKNGITKGTSGTAFSPDAACSRAQIVTFLNRAAKGEATRQTNPFTDVSADAYYYGPVLWAVEKGITTGTTKTTFSPDNDCTRAQIVTFIYRYMG